jgi:hypothetical protein
MDTSVGCGKTSTECKDELETSCLYIGTHLPFYCNDHILLQLNPRRRRCVELKYESEGASNSECFKAPKDRNHNKPI